MPNPNPAKKSVMPEPRRRPYGWDERDYRLTSQLDCLPSYGLLANDDRMVSLKQVVKTIEELAKIRGEKR